MEVAHRSPSTVTNEAGDLAGQVVDGRIECASCPVANAFDPSHGYGYACGDENRTLSQRPKPTIVICVMNTVSLGGVALQAGLDEVECFYQHGLTTNEEIV